MVLLKPFTLLTAMYTFEHNIDLSNQKMKIMYLTTICAEST